MTSSRRARLARRATSVAAGIALLATTVAAPPAHSADGPGGGTATVTGRLVGEGGAPPPALQPIELLRWATEDEEPQWSVEGSSDLVDGVFEFARLVPGVYTMRYDAPDDSGFYPQFLGGSPDQPVHDDGTATFAVSAGGRVTQDFELAGFRELTIDLRFDDGGAVPSSGQLAVFRWSAETRGWVEHADRFVPDTASDVVVGGLPVGRYAVHAEWEAPTDYPVQTAGGLVDLPGPDDDGVLVLAAGEPTSSRYEAMFRRGGWITAFVPAASGAEVLVELLRGEVRRMVSVAVSGPGRAPGAAGCLRRRATARVAGLCSRGADRA